MATWILSLPLPSLPFSLSLLSVHPSILGLCAGDTMAKVHAFGWGRQAGTRQLCCLCEACHFWRAWGHRSPLIWKVKRLPGISIIPGPSLVGLGTAVTGFSERGWVGARGAKLDRDRRQRPDSCPWCVELLFSFPCVNAGL